MENFNIKNNTEKENLDNRGITIICEDDSSTPMIGDKAPLFTADTTMGQIKLSDYMGKWVILFSHPGDFTPVCTTEFIAFARMYPEFEKRNCDLIGLSIDSTLSHIAWLNNIHKNTGIQIPFPLISDLTMSISKKYGMLAPNASTTRTVRCVFVIDPEQKIRAIIEYPLQIGRNIGEILRLLDALQFFDNNNLYTPANWLPGQPAVVPPPKTYQDIMDNVNNPTGFNCMDWYLCFTPSLNSISQMNLEDTNKIMSDNFDFFNKNNIQMNNCNSFTRNF